jgi:hypothetical protein
MEGADASPLCMDEWSRTPNYPLKQPVNKAALLPRASVAQIQIGGRTHAIG